MTTTELNALHNPTLERIDMDAKRYIDMFCEIEPDIITGKKYAVVRKNIYGGIIRHYTNYYKPNELQIAVGGLIGGLWLAEDREREEQARLKAHADALAARMDELRAAYPELKENTDNARSVGANVRKFFKKHFPELAVKISVRPDYWREAWEVSAEAPKDTPQEIRDRVAEVCEVWRDTMPSGEIWENERGSGEANICPMTELFGRVKYGVTPCYYL